MTSTAQHDEKRIVLLQGEFPCISATFILDQMIGLIDRGFTVRNWATYDPAPSVMHDSILKYGLNEITTYIKPPPSIKTDDVEAWASSFKEINNIGNLSDIDAFHVHYGALFNQFEHLFRYYRGFVMVSFHGYDASLSFKQHGDNCYDYLFQRADLITTPTYAMKDELVKRGCSPGKIMIHRYGIDLSRSHQCGNSGDKTALLSVARLEEKKGLKYSITAFARCRNNLNAEYRIIGDGSLKDELMGLITELGVSDKVLLLGPKTKDDVADAMAHADVFVLTSVTASNGDCEGLPVSLIEAHASGLPVISTYHAGIPELVTDGSTGFLVQERDIEATIEKMELLIDNPGLRRQLSSNAVRKVQSDFDIHTLNDILAGYLTKGIDKHRKSEAEISYWRERKRIEGCLGNGHYKYFYTEHFGLGENFYAGKKLLDIGCGPRGSVEWAMMAQERVGLDPLADHYRELGTDVHSMEYVASGSECMPFPDDYFDIVSSFNSLDHVDDLDMTIQEIKRVLRPGGTFLLFSDVNHKPTICEPISFSWDIVDKFTDCFRLEQKRHFEKSPQGIYIKDATPFDHSNKSLRMGVLAARFLKPAASDLSSMPRDGYHERADDSNRQLTPHVESFPLISIVIPVFNAQDTLVLCLDSISQLRYPTSRLETIVVDNGSTDSSVNIAGNYNVTLLHESSVKSSYAARNTGVKAARGDLIAFTDADCIVTPDWLTHLAAHWQDETAGCFAGEIEAYQPGDLIEQFSDRQGILRQSGTLSCTYLPYTQTANSAYRKSVFEQVGLFDPDMTSGGDADIAWRMQQKLGLKIKFVPEALVYHKHRTSIEGLFNQFRKYEHGKSFWSGKYPDYEAPSLEQRKNELDNSIARLTSDLSANSMEFIRDQIDFVDLCTPFLKYVMSLGTCKARFEIENSISSSATPLISVIIPTFNRAHLLKESLESLCRQTLPLSKFEVIVVDDGSRDFTKELCQAFSGRLRMVYRHIENSGISAAKNVGISLSSAPILFFFDDDDLAHHQLLEEHLRSHETHPDEKVAVLGYTTWSPSLRVSEVMRYVTETGQQLFSYPKIRHGQVLGYKHFWGGRSSCKKSFLMKYGVFRPEFRFGSEDIELGYRLDKYGLKVVYNKNAISYMNRAITFDEFCRRCEKQGRSQHVFSREHPDPAIRKYCLSDDISRNWAEREPLLERRTEETRDMELRAVQDRSLVQGLYSHYAWCFETYKIKGFVEALNEETGKYRPDDVIKARQVCANDDGSSQTLRSAHGQKTGLPAPTNGMTPSSILMIAKELPFHDRSSGNFRLFQIIRMLLSQGHSITFLARPSFRQIDDAPYIGELEKLGVKVFRIMDENIFLSGDETQDSLARLLTQHSFDIAYLMFYSIAELYLEQIRKHAPATGIIIDSVDIHFLREQRQSSVASSYQQFDFERNKAKELEAYKKADLVVVLTDVDRQALLTEAPQVRTVIVPNIHPEVPDAPSEFKTRRDVVFVGGFSHEPNVDAVEYLCNHIWPLVAHKIPEARLIIAGNAPPSRVARFASERIIITGYVQDLPALLHHCRVSIAPLRFGAGMKGKVGEALSHGMAVVATSIAAEGMGLIHDKHLLIADDPAGFADCLAQLYLDERLWSRLAMNGKSFIERNFSPAAVSGALQRMLSSLYGDMNVPGKDTPLQNVAPRNGLGTVDISQPAGQAHSNHTDRRSVAGMSFAIKIGAPDRTHTHWGDIYYAECLSRALERAGHLVRIHFLNEWGNDDLDIDVVIHLKGLSEYKPKPYNVNIMWMLNHPSLHTKAELETYDAVLVASLPHARRLKKELQVPVYPFLQATDPEHFRPHPHISKHFDLVFVGNNTGVDRLEMRQIIADILPTQHRLAVWGKGWEGKLPPGVLQGDFIPWQDLPMAYASGHIVLNDHQPEMKEYGFVNNRTFDAVACGATVISDHVQDIGQVLAVNTYTNRDELHALVDKILRDRTDSTDQAEHARLKVLQEFTFDTRVNELQAILDMLPAARERVRAKKASGHSFLSVKQPLVSVLMSTYNRRRFLAAAIASVKAQGYANWELILVNDGGEQVDDIVLRSADTRIRLVKLDANHGKGHAINRAFSESGGDFIAYLDDDDIWFPDHLERLLLPLLTIPGIEMAYSDAYDVWLREASDHDFREVDRKLRYFHQVTFNDLLSQNYIQGLSVVHRRDLFERTGGMDEKLEVLIDWDLWRRIAALTYPYHVSRVTAEHFFREFPETSGKGQITSMAQSDLVRYERNKLRVAKKKFDPQVEEEHTRTLSLVRAGAKRDFASARISNAEKKRDILRARRSYGHAIRLSDKERIGWLRRYAEFELVSGDPGKAVKTYDEAIQLSLGRGYVNYSDIMTCALLKHRSGTPRQALETLTLLDQGDYDEDVKLFINDFRNSIAASL
jgi:glycosyltransferase involved in cell wall biosynthesis/SAM-dependent methyltransferase